VLLAPLRRHCSVLLFSMISLSLAGHCSLSMFEFARGTSYDYIYS
jgi:hypothetical protein